MRGGYHGCVTVVCIVAIRFLGLKVPRAVLSGPPRPGVYLDSAATTLMAEPVERVMRAYLDSGFYSNPHSKLTTPSRVTSEAIVEARGLVARLVDAPEGHAVVFAGSGATEPLNILSTALFCDCGDRSTVVVTAQEHHSNLLPWMRSAKSCVAVPALDDGTLDLVALERFMREAGRTVRVIAVTAVSNVTGVRNPIGEIAGIAHRYGAQILVDASQAVAHVPLSMKRLGIDLLVASGHKMYAPGTPGFMVIPSTLPCDRIEIGNIGGGVVDRVSIEENVVEFKRDIVERLEGGTVNVPGIIGLGAAAKMLLDVDLQRVQRDEQALMANLLGKLSLIPSVRLYGPGDRTSIVSFGIEGIGHDEIAAALNDYHAISVRSGAFCAHPYVRRLLRGATGTLGLVRVSFGLYTTVGDIDALVTALRWIVQNRELITKDRAMPEASFSIAKEMAT